MNGKDAVDNLVVNGWALFGHHLFTDALEQLVGEVESLAVSEPHGFHNHPSYKLLRKLRECAFERIPADPSSRDFVGGKAFRGHTQWRRAKHGMPPRYRLFFQFRSDAPGRIIYAWFNDLDHLRKQGAKIDCYAVFSRMLDNGTVPNSFQALLKEAEPLVASDC